VTDKAEGQNVNPASASVRGVPCQEATALTDAETPRTDFVARWKAALPNIVGGQREIVRETIERIEQLEAAINGDATLAGLHVDGHGAMDIGVKHPLVGLMADALSKMIGDHSYVEMQMTHRVTGDKYLLLCQHLSRPTPHEFRRRAEERAEIAEAALAVGQGTPQDISPPDEQALLRVIALSVHPIWGRGN
jgi:hypothetical protein